MGYQQISVELHYQLHAVFIVHRLKHSQNVITYTEIIFIQNIDVFQIHQIK